MGSVGDGNGEVGGSSGDRVSASDLSVWNGPPGREAGRGTTAPRPCEVERVDKNGRNGRQSLNDDDEYINL